MERTITKQVRYGYEVMEHEQMDALRKTECMCRLCSRLKTGNDSGNCRIAQALYGICVSCNVAVAITRCPEFQAK